MPTDEQGAIPDELTDGPARSLTRPGGVPGATVYDRVLGLEFWRLEVERRLHEGVATFEGIKREVGALQPKPRSFLSMLPFLIPGIPAISAWPPSLPTTCAPSSGAVV